MEVINQTDMKTFSDELHSDMQSQLNQIANDNEGVIDRANESLLIIRSAINRLRDFIYDYQFFDTREEISFFKKVKPSFVSQYYYYDKIFSLKLNEPYGSKESINVYCYRQLEVLQEFVTENIELHSYCLSKATNYDDKYFTRDENCLRSVEYDAKFSTGYDLILGKIMANQRIKDYLLDMIKKSDTEVLSNGSSLTWTGTKASLIELIYALHSVDSIDNGNADIKKIATLFEQLFNIKLGNWYRHFQEIRLRKNRRTNFIDQMKKKLEERLDDFE